MVALSPFPNAVAISGHSHCAISDERTVWQGAFTSIGAGCVHAAAEGMESPVVRRIVAAGFAYPEECADIPGECLFSANELPAGRTIRLTVTPRDCFGLSGRPLASTFAYGGKCVRRTFNAGADIV